MLFKLTGYGQLGFAGSGGLRRSCLTGAVLHALMSQASNTIAKKDRFIMV